MSKNANIYKSCLNLEFEDQEVENEFSKMKDEALKDYNKIIVVASFIISLLISILASFQLKDFFTTRIIQYTIISSYFVLLVYSIFLFMAFYCKNIKTLRWMNYILFYLEFFISLSLRLILYRIFNSSSFFQYSHIILELVFRLTFVVLQLHSLKISLILNIMAALSAFILTPIVIPASLTAETYLNDTAYLLILSFVIGFSYFIEKQQRRSYYYWVSDRKSKRFLNVFDNMNSGFVTLKEGTISYMNTYLSKLLGEVKLTTRMDVICFTSGVTGTNLNRVKPSDIAQDVNITVSLPLIQHTPGANFNLLNSGLGNIEEERNHQILSHVLSNLNTDSIQNELIKNAISKFKEENKNLNNETLKIFTKLISQVPGIDKFLLVGDKAMTVDNNEINLEVQCRYNQDMELEIILNNVSRTKLHEGQNAEIKYKSLFLSKVAHEFKNPLICITELIEQANEHRDEENETSLRQTLSRIKSLSNFLLVLVKDLNHFSESEMGKDSVLEMKPTSVRHVISFCEDITESLLNKNNKSRAIDFKINMNKNVPEVIRTDEWRLKQVLINLLSNAVKFTSFGQISLEVSLEDVQPGIEKKLKFIVKDTGVGMKEEHKKNLFKPFQKGTNDNNEMGSGLGLSIANEIASKLGDKIEFTSQVGLGTSFWFEIPCIEDVKINNEPQLSPYQNIKENENTFGSSITIKLTNYVPSLIPMPTELLEILRNGNNCESSRSLTVSSNRKIENQVNPRRANSYKSPKVQNYQIQIDTKIEDPTYKRSNSKTITHNENIIYSLGIDFQNQDSPYKINNLTKIIDNIGSSISIDSQKEDSAYKRYSSRVLIHNENINTSSMNNNKFKKGGKESIITVTDFVLNNILQFRKDTENKSLKFLNVMVVDDEILTRQSSVRVLHKISEELDIKINVIEAEDGIEAIYLIYKSDSQGIKISMIFCDENMTYLNGTRTAEIIKEISIKKRLSRIPFYLVTAYDANIFTDKQSSFIDTILAKPLIKDVAKNIIQQLI